MAENKYYALRQSGLLLLVLLAWIISFGEARGQMLYKYIDEEGTYVITDNPPSEFKLVPDSPPDVMEEKRLELENEKEKQRGKTHSIQEAQEIGKTRADEIKAARDEWERARSYEDNYRLNMQAASNYNQRLYWREKLDKQRKVVEEMKKKLDEIMSLP